MFGCYQADLNMTGYNPYQGSAAPSMSMERGFALPYEDDPVPVTGESMALVEERSALFTPAQYQIEASYLQAQIIPQDNGVTWDYASNFLYYRPHAAPYPYVLVGR